jgi:putative FmdB family regulatory protein
MPLYEYQCDACEHRFEIIQQKFSDPSPETCPACGKGPVRQLLSSPAIQFKGSGFYITDYAKKGQTGESSEPAKESPEPAKSDGKKPDTASSHASTKTDGPAAAPASPSTTTKD